MASVWFTNETMKVNLQSLRRRSISFQNHPKMEMLLLGIAKTGRMQAPSMRRKQAQLFLKGVA